MQIFGRQDLARAMNRPHLLTRLIAPEQLRRKNVGINSVRSSRRSLNRNLGTELRASGTGSTDMSRLFAYVRKNGRAGMQGLHRDLGDRPRHIRGIIEKLRRDPNRDGKFGMVTVDPRRLQQNNIFDMSSSATRNSFIGAYPNFGKMYDGLAGEGVVVHKDHMPMDAVKSFRAFRGQKTQAEIDDLMEEMLDMGSAEPEPTFNLPTSRRDEDPDMGDGGGITT